MCGVKHQEGAMNLDVCLHRWSCCSWGDNAGEAVWGAVARGPGYESLCHHFYLPNGAWVIMGRNLLSTHCPGLAPIIFNLHFIK